MSRQRHPREVIVHCTVTFTDMAPVREWLAEHGGSVPRAHANAARAFLEALILSNAQWDNIPLSVRCDAPISPEGISL